MPRERLDEHDATPLSVSCLTCSFESKRVES
jgi:hypothetical protein